MITHTCTEHDKPISWEAYPWDVKCPVCDSDEITELRDQLEEAREDSQAHFEKHRDLSSAVIVLSKELEDPEVSKLIWQIWSAHK